MLDNKYLFDDVEVPEFSQYVINMRLSLLNKHLAKLLSVHYSERDNERINAVHKAVSWHHKINQQG